MKRAGLEVPSRYFHDLATWSNINRMYEARVGAELRQVAGARPASRSCSTGWSA